MNILIVGTSRGSGQIRGVQLGAAIGARVTAAPKPADWDWADTVVLVKHALEEFGPVAAKSKKRLVWDVLDWWLQPEQNSFEIEEMVAVIHRYRDWYGVSSLIGATRSMATAIGGLYLPHHSRPGLTPQPIRDKVQYVVYEGTPKYPGAWMKHLEQAAKSVGALFLVNPPNYQEADIVVAFRDAKWDGPLCRKWKSGVKIANALAIGRPIVTQGSAALIEMNPPSLLVEAATDLRQAMAMLLSKEVRVEALVECRKLAAEFTLDAVAKRYLELLQPVGVGA